jgi:predicted porin
MKKLLIAAAALAMVAGTAQAQSSVTVYGAVGASSNSFKTNGSNVPTAFQSRSDDYLSTTNLGFTGTEDLGSGNKAFFRLEGDLGMQGSLGGAGSDANPIFNRHAHVGIETKQFGTFSVGRQNDSIKDLEGLGQVYNLSDNLHMNTQVGDRYAQIYKYATPTFNGLKATYSYSNGPANGNAVTDTVKQLNSFAVTYNWKNYSFGAGQGTIKDVATANTGDLETTYLGARATFGAFTVGAAYVMNEQKAAGTAAKKEANQTMVSVNYNMGAIDLKAHYVKDDANDTAGLTKVDGDGYGLMAVYNLSKRTAAYVGYADYDKDGGNSGDQKVTTVGVFHRF